MRAIAAPFILGSVLGLTPTLVHASPANVEPFLASHDLDPVRSPDRVELFAVQELPPVEPAAGALAPTPGTFPLAPDPVAVPPNVARDLSRVLLTASSYRASQGRCLFAPEVALRFHQGPSSVDALISLFCIDLLFQRADVANVAPTLELGGGAWELLELLRRTRPTDSRLYHVQRDWASRGGQALQAPDARRRWLDGMPAALRPFWREPSDLLLTYEPQGTGRVQVIDASIDPQAAALAQDMPDATQRIRALLQWYGCGIGPWSGYPSYEGTAALLLLTNPTPDLIAAVQSAPLSAEQKEGAARLFAGWEFRRSRPKDGKLLPPDLRQQLLEHSRLSRDEDRTLRAEAAFAPEHEAPKKPTRAAAKGKAGSKPRPPQHAP